LKTVQQPPPDPAKHGVFNASIRDRTRREIEIEWYDATLTSAEGQLIGVLCTGQDITEKRRAVEALHDREERLRAILNTAADAIITIDGRGIIEGVNAATERLFGYASEELIGQNVSILMPQPYRDEHDEYIRRYLETGKARIIGIGREVLGRRKDGSTFPVGLAVSEVDHLGLFTGIIRDVSAQRKLQRDVISIADDEQRRIGQDLHDSTQQELVGLGMLTQTLLSILTQESRDRPSAAVEKSCELVEKILNGLGRAQQEVQIISRGLVPITLDPAGLMDALRELARRTDEVCGVSCAFKCEQPVEVAKSFTATHLYRIAQEAITNALKHARPEHILIALESDNGQVTLQVADDGTGFDPDEQSDGMGLKTMQYRAVLIGANLAIRHIDTGGTLVTCNVFNRWG